MLHFLITGAINVYGYSYIEGFFRMRKRCMDSYCLIINSTSIQIISMNIFIIITKECGDGISNCDHRKRFKMNFC